VETNGDIAKEEDADKEILPSVLSKRAAIDGDCRAFMPPITAGSGVLVTAAAADVGVEVGELRISHLC
jgi:hypothetical protein